MSNGIKRQRDSQTHNGIIEFWKIWILHYWEAEIYDLYFSRPLGTDGDVLGSSNVVESAPISHWENEDLEFVASLCLISFTHQSCDHIEGYWLFIVCRNELAHLQMHSFLFTH